MVSWLSPFNLYELFVNYIFGGVYWATLGVVAVIFLILILLRASFTSLILFCCLTLVAFFGILNPVFNIMFVFAALLFAFLSTVRALLTWI